MKIQLTLYLACLHLIDRNHGPIVGDFGPIAAILQNTKQSLAVVLFYSIFTKKCFATKYVFRKGNALDNTVADKVLGEIKDKDGS